MISIIICCSNLEKISIIEDNIKKTIELQHEIIVIDNSNSQYSIFEAYNLGVEKSKYSILCFMHDDIVYHSVNWGNVVVNHLKDEKVGMIGVSGTRFLSNLPTIWWAGGHKYFESINGTICHNCIDTNRNNLDESMHNIINPTNKITTDVVILDGLWFCMRKKLFSEIKFDSINYKGFHFYDLDISMQVRKNNYRLLCIYNIKIEHISASKLDCDWLNNCQVFYNKWKPYLPVNEVNLNIKQLISIKYNSFRIYRNIFIRNKKEFQWFSYIKHEFSYRLFIFYMKSIFKN